MAKRARLSEFVAKKETPAPTVEPATPEAEASPKQIRGQTLRLNLDAWRQLKTLAVMQDRKAHDLLIEAVNDLFKKYGKPPIA